MQQQTQQNTHHLSFGQSTMTVGNSPIGPQAQQQAQQQPVQQPAAQASMQGQGAMFVGPAQQQQPVIQRPQAGMQQAPQMAQGQFAPQGQVPQGQMQVMQVPQTQLAVSQPQPQGISFAEALRMHREVLDKVRELAGVAPDLGLWNVPGLDIYLPSPDVAPDVMSMYVSPAGMIGNEIDIEALKADAERSSGWGVIKTTDPNAPLAAADVPSAFLAWAVYQTPPLVSALFVLDRTNPTLLQQAVQALGISGDLFAQTFQVLDREFAAAAQATGEYWALRTRIATGTLTEDINRYLGPAPTTGGWGWGWGWQWTSRQKLYGR